MAELGRGIPSPAAVVKLPQHPREHLHLLLQERPHLIHLCKELGASLQVQLPAIDVPEQMPETQKRPQPLGKVGGQDPGADALDILPPSGSGVGCASLRPEATPRPAPGRCARRHARPPSRSLAGCSPPHALSPRLGMSPTPLRSLRDSSSRRSICAISRSISALRSRNFWAPMK